MIRKIIKNSLWILIAQFIGKIIAFIYTMFLARSLGVEDFGLYIVALSYFTLASIFSDFGINRFLIREISNDNSSAPKLISTAIIIRLFITSIIFMGITLLMNILDPLLIRRNLVMLGIAAVIPQSIALTFDAIYIALLKIKYSALSLLVVTIFTSLLGIVLVLLKFGVYSAILSLIVGQLLYVLILVIFARRNNINWLGLVDERKIVNMIKGSLPYGILGILGLLYFKIDSLLLTYIRGPYETGIYGASYKFLEAIMFIPASFFTAAFPVLTRLQNTNNEEIKGIYYKSLKWLFLISLFITLIFILLLPMAIGIILPKYDLSANAIRILALTIPFMFMQTPATLVLFSSDKYLKQVIYLSLGTVMFNIILNLLFIPSMGYIGASIVTVLSEILSFVVFYCFLKIKVLK